MSERLHPLAPVEILGIVVLASVELGAMVAAVIALRKNGKTETRVRTVEDELRDHIKRLTGSLEDCEREKRNLTEENLEVRRELAEVQRA